MLLADEQITVRDDNYFPSPPTSPSPGPSKSATGALAGGGTEKGAGSTVPGTPDAQKDNAAGQARAEAEAQAKAEAERAIEEHNQLLINSMSLIEWDLPRTYPTLGELMCCMGVIGVSASLYVEHGCSSIPPGVLHKCACTVIPSGICLLLTACGSQVVVVATLQY
jgi:hypothetical protein